MDTPLLHYNTGVAHYRAQQHIRARTALLKAVQSPGLRVISQYNLGLTANALGDVDDALHWFRQARDQVENEKIREFATPDTVIHNAGADGVRATFTIDEVLPASFGPHHLLG